MTFDEVNDEIPQTPNRVPARRDAWPDGVVVMRAGSWGAFERGADGVYRKVCPGFSKRSPDADLFLVNWAPSAEDLAATDWRVLEETA